MSRQKLINTFSAALCIQLFILSSCATYSPDGKATLTPTEILKKNETVIYEESCELHVVVLKDKELAKNYVGIDPGKSSMMPVFMKIANSGNVPIKVDILGSLLLTNTGEPFSSLSIDAAISNARRGDAEVAAWTLAFGLMGAMVSGGNTASTNKSLEEDYHQKAFKPSLINTKASGEGLIFFSVPAEKQALINAAIIQLLNPTSNETKKVTVRF